MTAEFKNHCNIQGDTSVCTNIYDMLSSTAFYQMNTIGQTLFNRTMNCYAQAIDSSKTFSMPSAETGISRDFALYCPNVLSSGSVIFSNVDAGGDDVNYVAEQASQLEAETGKNIFYFTELKKGTFLVSRKTVYSVETDSTANENAE